MSSPLLKLVGLLVGTVLLILVAAWWFQRRMIYFPFQRRIPAAGSVLTGAAEVELSTRDGLGLDAWFVPPRGVGRARATVLVFHGNAGDRADRAPLAVELARHGFAVLLTDYRGYGGNPGAPTERGLALDARGAHDLLLSRPDVDPSRLIYFGESLGAAVALELALERPPALLVLRSPFTSLTDIGRLHYPLLPVRLLLRDRYPSIDRVSELQCPLLVIAGERDRIVPAANSRALFDAAPPATSRFVLVPGVGHNDRELLDGRRMLEAIESLWCETHPETCVEGT